MINFDLSELTGEVITRDDFSYEEDRKGWNRANEQYPFLIIYCYKNEDVSNAIVWAKSNSLPIRVRSGRHNYEGYSNGNDVVIIDISKMNNISLDEENNKVTIQCGVQNREINKLLGGKEYQFPGGGCPTVAIPGLVLGGGWGYSSRVLGLGCDSLVELEMIDYNGEKIVANKNINEDLFWASKGGGGGNFGIVVSMTFELSKKISMATLINIDYQNIDKEESIEIVQVWQNMFKDLDRRINLKMGIYNSEEKGNGIRITGLFYGNEEEANNILAPLKNINNKKNINKMYFNLEYTTILEANRKIQDSHPDYEKYKSSGRFVYKDYSKEELKNIIELIKSRAEGSIYTAISFYGLGGAVSDTMKESTAFYYRDAKFIMGIQSVWEEAKYAPINRQWIVEKFKYIKSITVGSFINFPLAELENYEKEYYGENIDKLKKIKRKYDPHNVFSFPQGIKGN